MSELHPKILKNQLFFKAVDYLIEKKYVESQKELSAKIGVSESTLSNLRNDRKLVSDKTIYKLMDAFPGIFNVAYFRGENIYMLVKDAMEAKVDAMQNQNEIQSALDQSSLINATIAAQMKTIEILEAQAVEKDIRIAELKDTIASKEEIIKAREARIVELERQLAAAATSDLSRYPFSFGAADGRNRPDVSPNP